jgi:hypothetical protein
MLLVLFIGKVITEVAIFSNNIEYKNKLRISDVLKDFD